MKRQTTNQASRELATGLGVSRKPVSCCYEKLTSRGLIYAEAGERTFVRNSLTEALAVTNKTHSFVMLKEEITGLRFERLEANHDERRGRVVFATAPAFVSPGNTVRNETAGQP